MQKRYKLLIAQTLTISPNEKVDYALKILLEIKI